MRIVDKITRFFKIVFKAIIGITAELFLILAIIAAGFLVCVALWGLSRWRGGI